MEELVIAAHEVEVPEEKLRVMDDGGRVLDPRQLVEGDERLRCCDAADDGSEGGVFFIRMVDKRHHNCTPSVQEDVGELHHGDEVANGKAGVQNHSLLHRFV